MRRLLRDEEVGAELDKSGMETRPILSVYAPGAVHALLPRALHLTRGQDPFLWWHEGGQTFTGGDRRPVAPLDCFLRFCALHDAPDEAVVNFAEHYGVLGIWPCRREFCVIDLPRSCREKIGTPAVGEYALWERAPMRAPWGHPFWEEFSRGLDQWREAQYQNECFYADAEKHTWYGEPVALWRRLAKHLRALARIGARLHRDELPPESDWEEVMVPGETDPRRFVQKGDGVFYPLSRIEAQRAELQDLINLWLSNVTAMLLYERNVGVVLDTELLDENRWGPHAYEQCEADGLASRDLRALSGWYRDGPRDFETRPSLLLNLLILQLTSVITSGAAFCPLCGNPSDPHGPSGKRLPSAKTYCGEGCRAEARKETKRNSWHKAQKKEGGPTDSQ